MATLFVGGVGTVLPERTRPVAVIVAEPEIGVIGATVRLHGETSIDPDAEGLSYAWSFDTTPIGSTVSLEGFRSLNDDGSLVWFSPDRVGEYVVRLTVANAHFSSSTTQRVSIRAILVPDGRGIVPDGKFIWSYIRDVWQQVDNKEIFEALWSALIQICGTELLRLYQVDFNKSIRDIQEKMQRRWLSYEPRLELDATGMSVFLGNEAAGTDASTVLLGVTAKAVLLPSNVLIVVEGSVLSAPPSTIRITYSRDATNVGEYRNLGLTTKADGYRLGSTVLTPGADTIMSVEATFDFQSRVWAVASDDMFEVRVGDVAHVASGVNQGFYVITEAATNSLTVATAPPGASLGEAVTIYRPVGIAFEPDALGVSSSFSIQRSEASSPLEGLAAGRLLRMGGRTYPISKVLLDSKQAVPTYVITTEQPTVATGRYGLAWRIPNTLVAPGYDFEALGVAAGDTLVVDLTDEFASNTVVVDLQVVGVSGNRIGFTLSTDPLTPGSDYSVSDRWFGALMQAFRIERAVLAPNGDVIFSSRAKVLYDYVYGTSFQLAYWNKELSLEDGIQTPLGKFFVRPRAVVRNSLLPVDASVVSVPVLQEWLSQPEIVERDGKVYQLRGSTEHELPHRPVALVEGNDYVVDDETAFDDQVLFRTGTNVLEVDGGGFVDRHVEPGDYVVLSSPSAVVGEYLISEVLGQDALLLSTPIPSAVTTVVSGRVSIRRWRTGRFLRFVPGGFLPASPAPDRLWAETTYFDNSDAIEANFGILVGLTREDLEKVSSRVSYRQAVAGLMFAYTRGSSVEKVRLGAQILLGLPFAEHRGIIRSIDPDYRLDASGNPSLGRLLIEDTDVDGTPMGVQRVYTYPIDPESSDLAGVETSPVTGVTYKVGDAVDLFAPLVKGVEVSDYVAGTARLDSSAQSQLQKYHSFRIRANDNIFDLAEVGLVSDFLRRITPSYVAFILSDVMQTGDDIDIEDFVGLRVRGTFGVGLVDNTGFGLSTAVMYDAKDFSDHWLARLDDGLFRRRAAGADALTDGSATIAVSGGLVSSPLMAGSISKPGDFFVFLTGPNQGTYEIATVTDTEVTLSGSPYLEAAEDQEYVVLRKVDPLISSGTIAGVASVAATAAKGVQLDVNDLPVDITGVATSRVTLSAAGAVVDGVMAGDWFVTLGKRYLISEVTDTTVRVVPELSSWQAGDAYGIYRQAFLPSPYDAMTGTLGASVPRWTLSGDLPGLLSIGDILVAVSPAASEKTVLDPGTLTLSDRSAGGESYTVKMGRKNASPAPIGLDLLERDNIKDEVWLTAVPSTTLTSVAGGTSIALDVASYDALSPKPGDLLHFTTLNQINNGSGVGVFVVTAIYPGTHVVDLSHAMTQNGASGWSLTRRL